MPRKILHVVGGMNRGGVETWLMRIFRKIDRSQFEFHFLVHRMEEGAYDNEIQQLGGRIHRCPSPRSFPKYARRLRAILDNNGPFDVVHSHVYLYSGLILRIAARAGIPIRIAHIHTNPKYGPFDVHRRIYRRLMNALIARYATKCIAVTRECLTQIDPRSMRCAEVIYCGIDFAPFLNRPARDEARAALSLPRHRYIVGHVGRFTRVKNHAFLIEIFSRLLASGIDGHLLLIGDGPLKTTICRLAKARGLLDRVTFTGLQSDVVPFLSAMDVFVFPSLYEGFPVALLEAQAAGLVSIVSSCISGEIDALPQLIQRIRLDEGPEIWSAAIARCRGNRESRQPAASLEAGNKFSLETSLESLARIYQGLSPAAANPEEAHGRRMSELSAT